MYIGKDLVLEILDKSVKEFDSNLIAVNTLPDDAIFEIYIDDTVTAEYYDEEKDELFRFKIDYDYFSPTSSKYELEMNRLNIDMKRSLDTRDEYGLKTYNIKKTSPWKVAIGVLIGSGISLLLIRIALGLYR